MGGGIIWLLDVKGHRQNFTESSCDEQKANFSSNMQLEWHQTLEAISYQRKLNIKIFLQQLLNIYQKYVLEFISCNQYLTI